MKKILLGLFIASSAMMLASCSSPEDVKAARSNASEHNKEALKSPEIVGTLPDGQIVKLVVLKRVQSDFSTTRQDHFVYYVGQAISNNYEIPSGRTMEPVVDVYLPEKPTNAQILAAAEKIKKEDYLKRKETYEKLKLEFENNKE